MAVMMNPRERWTDERLDDLNQKVDLGFAEMRQGFERIDARLDRMQNTLFGAAAVIIAALLGIIATQL